MIAAILKALGFWGSIAAGLALVLLVAVGVQTWRLDSAQAAAAQCAADWKAENDAEDDEAARRQAAADDAAVEAAQDGATAVTDTREETHEATERVRVEWRERVVRVPAECRAAVALPGGVQAEGRAAVERARGALSAAQNRRDR